LTNHSETKLENNDQIGDDNDYLIAIFGGKTNVIGASKPYEAKEIHSVDIYDIYDDMDRCEIL
jgi:tryptophan synthase beta subunit